MSPLASIGIIPVFVFNDKKTLGSLTLGLFVVRTNCCLNFDANSFEIISGDTNPALPRIRYEDKAFLLTSTTFTTLSVVLCDIMLSMKSSFMDSPSNSR